MVEGVGTSLSVHQLLAKHAGLDLPLCEAVRSQNLCEDRRSEPFGAGGVVGYVVVVAVVVLLLLLLVLVLLLL